jgi:exodeoxyribonuclease X
MRFRVVDLETTGLEPPAEIIEIGRSDLVWDANGASVEPPMAWLYRPLHGIPPETMAVHHITEADFGPQTPVCTPEYLRAAIAHGAPTDVLVAHNCEFERKFITSAVTGATPWICTYKVALHVWPDAPRHGNQVLRYWRGFVLDPALAMPPHRAGPDAWVTAHLLGELLKETTVDQMISWTNAPRHMPVITFGKHRGLAWSALPIDYLQWMVQQATMDEDAVWHAKQELAHRP